MYYSKYVMQKDMMKLSWDEMQAEARRIMSAAAQIAANEGMTEEAAYYEYLDRCKRYHRLGKYAVKPAVFEDANALRELSDYADRGVRSVEVVDMVDAFDQWLHDTGLSKRKDGKEYEKREK